MAKERKTNDPVPPIPDYALRILAHKLGTPCDFEGRSDFKQMKPWCAYHCGKGTYEDCWREFFVLYAMSDGK